MLSNVDTSDVITQKDICFVGMSGVGKTYLSNMLRNQCGWYHYSVDYRIGTRYLAPIIDDNLRKVAMEVPCFRDLLRSDALRLEAKIGLNNLDVMSSYLGSIGDPEKGALTKKEFLERQDIHYQAEVSSMADLYDFKVRSKQVLEYANLVCDTSGSFCSVVDPWDARDPILTRLQENFTIVYIEGQIGLKERLIERFRARPKPIYYSGQFFEESESLFLKDHENWEDVEPDQFANWAFERLIDFRIPRYEAIAEKWGKKINSERIAQIRTGEDLNELIAEIQH